MISNDQLGSIAGKHLVGTDGDRIGKITDVYESTDGGEGTFATVTTGLFGGGASFFPLDAAELTGDEVRVPFSKDQIKDAPRVENDDELTAPEEARLFEYYSGGARQPVTGANDVQTRDQDRDLDRDRDMDVDRDRDRDRETVGHDTSGPTTDTAMTRSEEQLTVGTEKVETGRARLKKFVVTEMQTKTVPVSREEVRIEREPITDANRPSAMDGPDISEEEHEVVLHEERAVVNKETVPVERVRLDTETVTEQQTVSEEVRKEQIDTETDGTDTRRS